MYNKGVTFSTHCYLKLSSRRDKVWWLSFPYVRECHFISRKDHMGFCNSVSSELVSEVKVSWGWDVVESCPQTPDAVRVEELSGPWLADCLICLGEVSRMWQPVHWPLGLASSPLTCPISVSSVSLSGTYSHLRGSTTGMRINASVSKTKRRLTISDCGLTTLSSGCCLHFVAFDNPPCLTKWHRFTLNRKWRIRYFWL